jgi:ABC-type uncharacterized transport system involved in gliding motility auxiliary subunit
MDNATPVSIGRGRAERSPVWISISEENLNQDDPVSADLNLMVFPVAGYITDVPGVTNEIVPLVQSSANSSDVDAFAAQYGAEQIRQDFTPGMEPMTLAARVSGQFNSAFPDGPPAEGGPTNSLEHSVDTSTIIIVADVDVLADQFNYRNVNFLGVVARQQFNNNSDFALNAIDQMGGDNNLIAIRSRKKFQRPFTVVEDLEREAQDRWQAKERELSQELQTVRQKLNELQAQKDESQRYVLSDEQRQQIELFRERQAEVSRELKEVQKNLSKDIDRLGYRLQFYNMALVPLGVCVFGLSFAFYRQAKVKRS